MREHASDNTKEQSPREAWKGLINVSGLLGAHSKTQGAEDREQRTLDVIQASTKPETGDYNEAQTPWKMPSGECAASEAPSEISADDDDEGVNSQTEWCKETQDRQR